MMRSEKTHEAAGFSWGFLQRSEPSPDLPLSQSGQKPGKPAVLLVTVFGGTSLRT